MEAAEAIDKRKEAKECPTNIHTVGVEKYKIKRTETLFQNLSSRPTHAVFEIKQHMEHCDQEMYAQHDFQDDPYHSSVYPSDILSFQTPASFVIPEQTRQRFPPSDTAFRSHNHHNHHEAEHVYNSPHFTLDPSTLDLRPNPCDDISPSVSNQTGSSSTTPTGSLRISPYNLPSLSSTGVVTRRKARAALEQLQIQTQVSVGSHSVELQEQQQGQQTQPHSFHSNHDPQTHLHHQTSDMHDVQMQQGELQMHVDGHNHPLIDSIHRQQPHGLTQHSQLYPVLSDTSTSSTGFYLSSESFSNSPTTVSTPADASPHSDLQPISPTSTLGSSPSSTIPLARSFRSGSLSLGMTANRSLSLITTSSTGGSIGQPLSPSHLHGPPLSAHPHMHPTPYYINHGSGSPAYPSTPPASHHAQGSSSSSRSSGQTHYSLRGSPVPRAFGRHGRSSSYGTSSTMSVRSTSPTSSIITSLSGGGSTPSTSGPLGSPVSYGENGDMQMPFGSSHDPPHPSVVHFSRAQSHPPAVIPNYPSLSHQHRKSYLGHESYATTRGTNYVDSPRDSVGWPDMRPETYIHTNSRLTDEEFQAQFPPKPLITRAPHRKQKLANSDRKAICMYAKQHPSARQEDIAARYNVERSTISKILKNKERWLGCPDDDAKVARKRKPRFDDLELVLKVWVEETRPQKIVLSDALIRSKAKEEARRLGILEDKFKASSGWLENFKHRVGIRKGKYIGRDHWQEGSESDVDDPNGQRFQDQRTNWSKSHSDEASKGNWDLSIMGSTSPLKEGERIQQLSLPDLEEKQSGFPSEELNHAHSSPQVTDARLGSRPEDNRAVPIMRKTRSRTLAENKGAASITSSPSVAELPNSSNLPASSIIGSRTIASDSSTANSSLSVTHMGTTLLSRPHDTSAHVIVKEEPNSPIGRPSSRGASETLGTSLDLIGSQGFTTNRRADE